MGGRVIVASAVTALTLGAGWAAAAPAPKPKAGLDRFDSCRAFIGHVHRHALATVGPYGFGGSALGVRVKGAPVAVDDRAAVAPSLAAPVSGVDFSGTNLQEAGVDEPDIVKTDGRTIFSIAGGTLQIVDVSGATPRRLGSLELDAIQPSGLILLGDRLLVLGDGGSPLIAYDGVATGKLAAGSIAPSWTPSTVLVQLDVSDPGHPRVVTRMKVDGSLVSARRTDSTVRVVLSSATSRIAFAQPAADSGAGVRVALRANRRAVGRSNASAWLPRITIRDARAKRTEHRAAVGCRAVSRPAEYSGLGMVDVLTLGAADELTLLDSDAILTDGDLAYASPTALYIATARWADPALANSATPPRGSTLIHKLDISDPAQTTYRASGTVRGYLLNQFSLSEYQGVLRAASTEFPQWWSPPDAGAAPSEGFVTALGEHDGRLATIGQVGGLGRGEQIYAVRFIGTRGFVVTFHQTDPLYALDLSDPTHPVVRGQLTIPGYSSYLQPIDDNTIIGIGQAADPTGRIQGTQVSLFDVSDLDAPRRIAQRTLDVAWSEAESDHHAVLFWPATHELVVPGQSYDPEGRTTFLGAVGLTVTPQTGITPIARVRHPDQSSETWTPVRRALVVGDALYTVSDTGMLASDLTTLTPRTWVSLK